MLSEKIEWILAATLVGSTAGAGEDCPDFATAASGGFCEISGQLAGGEFRLDASRRWLIMENTVAGENTTGNLPPIRQTTLIVDPGTTVAFGSGASLSVTENAELIAAGTRDEPILFTSLADADDDPDTKPAPGDWLGIAIHGRAPINPNTVRVPTTELGIPVTIGDDPGHSSGVLTFTTIAYAGGELSPDDQISSLILIGVGFGTELHHLVIRDGGDDGIEFDGGTVNWKYIALARVLDDGFDFTHGYRGKGQFGVVQMRGSRRNRGIETDNADNDPGSTPRTAPQLANMTVIGSERALGAIFRTGSSGRLVNSLVSGFCDCLDLDQTDVVPAADFSLDGLRFECPNPFEDEGDEPYTAESVFRAGSNNLETGQFDRIGFLPLAMPPDGVAAPGDSFFDDVTYIGAFAGPEDDWTAGWSESFEDLFDATPGPACFEGPNDAFLAEGTTQVSAVDGERVALGQTNTAAGGRISVFRIVGSAVVLQAFEDAPSDVQSVTFGSAVAIEDDLVAVGAPDVATVFLYRLEDQNLTPVDRVSGGPGFGFAVGLRDGELLVGAPDSDLGTVPKGALPTGAAFVYGVGPSGIGTEMTVLPPPSVGPGGRFGASVTLGPGGALGVGAPGAVGGATAGSVAVYEQVGQNLGLVETMAGATPGDGFGASIGIEGDTLLVGAPGEGTASIFNFGFGGATVSPVQFLVGTGFGTSVAIVGGNLVIGDPERNRAIGLAGGDLEGTARILRARNGGEFDLLGSSVAIGSGFALVQGAERGAIFDVEEETLIHRSSFEAILVIE